MDEESFEMTSLHNNKIEKEDSEEKSIRLQYLMKYDEI